MKNRKINPERALAKIKILIDEFYSKVGREIYEDIDEARSELLEKIDEITSNAKIDPKFLIIEKIDYSEEDSKNTWKESF